MILLFLLWIYKFHEISISINIYCNVLLIHFQHFWWTSKASFWFWNARGKKHVPNSWVLKRSKTECCLISWMFARNDELLNSSVVWLKVRRRSPRFWRNWVHRWPATAATNSSWVPFKLGVFKDCFEGFHPNIETYWNHFLRKTLYHPVFMGFMLAVSNPWFKMLEKAPKPRYENMGLEGNMKRVSGA